MKKVRHPGAGFLNEVHKNQLLRQKLFILFALFTACLSRLYAQTTVGNLEFIENKGQWDSAVRYRAEMPNSLFFLQKHGFSVLLQSPADMQALREALHGVPSANSNSGTTVKSSTSKKAGVTTTLASSVPIQLDPPDTHKSSSVPNTGNAGLLMHSHFYQVEFLNSSE